MIGTETPFDAEHTWEDFWVNIGPVWRRVLCGSDTDTPPPAGPILRRHRLTTDYFWVGSFEPVRWLPAVTEALLWDENGMDLGPLTGRSWELLQLGGPATVDLKQLSGTPVRQLILSNVHVADMSSLLDIEGLKSLTLAYGDFGSLPPLDQLTELVLHPQVDVDLADALRPDLRVTRRDEDYFPPFGPDDV